MHRLAGEAIRSPDARLFDLEHPPPAAQAVREPGGCELTLALEHRPARAKPGQQITWQLVIENSGGCPLQEVTARSGDGQALGDVVELPRGRRHTIRWTEPLDPELRHLITVTARDRDRAGSSILNQISATAAAAAREAEPKDESQAP